MHKSFTKSFTRHNMEDQFNKWNDAWSGLFSSMKKAADAIGKLTDTLNDLNYQQALFEAEANFLSSYVFTQLIWQVTKTAR